MLGTVVDLGVPLKSSMLKKITCHPYLQGVHTMSWEVDLVMIYHVRSIKLFLEHGATKTLDKKYEYCILWVEKGSRERRSHLY